MKARKIPITATTAIMSTCPSRRESPPRAAAPAPARRLRRLAAAATAIIGSLLASAAVIPAASAAVPTPVPTIPPGWAQLAQLWRLGPVRVVPATTVRVVSAGGMAGWQITLIAAGAAVAAAVAAVVLDRARAARRAASAPAS
jgi:hypothetical protein